MYVPILALLLSIAMLLVAAEASDHDNEEKKDRGDTDEERKQILSDKIAEVLRNDPDALNRALKERMKKKKHFPWPHRLPLPLATKFQGLSARRKRDIVLEEPGEVDILADMGGTYGRSPATGATQLPSTTATQPKTGNLKFL